MGAELELLAHGARDEADKAGVPCRHCFGSAGIVAIGRDGEKTSGHDLCPVTAKCFHHLHAIVYDVSFFFYYGIYTIVYEDGWIMDKR